MNDPRFRLASAFILSVAAFASIYGAFLAAGWWVIFSRRTRSLPAPKKLFFAFAAIAGVGAFIWISGGDGVSYLLRFSAILLIAAWVHAEHRSGEFLSVSVWLFGEGLGFDLGLVAEMAMQNLAALEDDLRHIRIAHAVKEQKGIFPRIVSIASTLILSQVRRTRDQAVILAVRGYRGGGRTCPAFAPTFRDPADLIAAISIIIITGSPLFLIPLA
jgi:hypothetical protein